MPGSVPAGAKPKWRTVKHDLFGVIDGLAFPRRGTEHGALTVAIQWTTDKNMQSHIRKMEAEPRVQVMRDAGWEIRLWCFDGKTGDLVRDLCAKALRQAR